MELLKSRTKPNWPNRTLAILGLLALVISLAVLAFTLDTSMLGQALSAMGADPVGLTIAVAAFAFAFLLRAIAWARVLPKLSLSQALAGIHLSLGANHVLPFRLGEPFRVASVVRRASVSLDAAASSSLVLRSADIATVVGLSLIHI